MISREIILKLISFTDLTSLEPTDNAKTLEKIINKANHGFNGVYPAAVCVYPNLGPLVKKQLNNSVKTAVVGGSFPTGQATTATKIFELSELEKTEINEVDIVINRGEFLLGNYDYVFKELSAMRKTIPSKTLKVILETGELKEPDLIAKAANIAIESGADFIKTSTGKCAVGATPEAVQVMCRQIARHHQKTNQLVGIKPSGGVRTPEQALTYYDLVLNELGAGWLTPDLFRIGASSLYDLLIEAWHHETDQ